MALSLHLGVVDVPYATPPRVGKKGKLTSTSGLSTGDVAEILEAKYHVMRSFWELHGPEIVKDLEKGLEGVLEAIVMKAPVSLDPFGDGLSKTQARFKRFLANREMERLGYPGVPTKAALAGVNHRMLHPYAKRKRRPSFVDTGQYLNAFKAWID